MFLAEIPGEHLEIVDSSDYYSSARNTESAETSKYRPGTAVFHEDYGSGIIARSGTAGGQIYVIVQFESGRSGRFLPAYDAHLEIFGNDEWQ